VSLPSLAGLAILGLAVAPLAIAGCGQSGSTPANPGPGSSVLAPGSLGPPASVAPGATPLVRIDPSLLAVLPQRVADQSVLESSEVEARASGDASLARIAESAVGAQAIDPGPGDYVQVLVARLVPGALDPAAFQAWRDAYDLDACAGTGVADHAEREIGGRDVFVATCSNGPHTYHAWIPDSRLLVSARSGGPRDLGELLFQELTP
jgi:hypothetical protein